MAACHQKGSKHRPTLLLRSVRLLGASSLAAYLGIPTAVVVDAVRSSVPCDCWTDRLVAYQRAVDARQWPAETAQ